KYINHYTMLALLVIAVCLAVKNFSVICEVFHMIITAVMPLVTGCAIAYIFNIIMNFYEKHYFPENTCSLVIKSRRPVCLGLAFMSAIFIIVLVVSIVYPELAKAFRLICNEIPELFTRLQIYTRTRLKQSPAIQNFISSIEPDITGLSDTVGNGAYNIFDSLVSFIGSTVSFITDIIIAVIFALYILMRKDKLSSDIKRIGKAFLPAQVCRYINHVLEIANNTFRNFFVGQFMEGIIIGVLCFTGMTILRLPYAVMAGTVVGVTALIPIVGAVAGMSVSAFIIFTASPVKALVFVIFLLILQQLEDNIIYPAIVGTSTGLPAIWVLASITVGGSLFGVTGMLLGVPTTATIYKLASEFLERRENSIKNEV
ncbi:MAG: AI-2E family transporter, partial [Ruminococcus sp.]|nr:AI-2E family transporter [Ruminococcus sp.]